MSFSTWLARRGNVGGTARWAGKLYLKIKSRNEAETIDSIMCTLVEVRYSSNSMRSAKEEFLNQIHQGSVRGLVHLVTNILSLEAGFRENTPENRSMFIDIINEELSKLNIPQNDIFQPRA